MYRSIATDAVVIRRDRMGDFHKILTLLTSGLGLITATAFGAYKTRSSLRMGSEPLTHSHARLYLDPVRRSYKVTELEVRESFEGVRGDIEKICAASLWAEVAQRSFGAGETSDALYTLFTGCLRLLDPSDAPPAPYLTVQFLWRFLCLSGYVPDPKSCNRCGSRLDAEAVSFFEPSGSVFLCGRCARPSSASLPAGARRYLGASERLPLAEAAVIRLEGESLRQLETCLLAAVQSVLEGELKSLRVLGASR
jgi:DNA repair protein RecO (recombination protein O)